MFCQGIFVYSWIYNLLRKSRKKTINLDDLYTLLPEFDAESLTNKLEKNWYDEVRKHPNDPSFIWATIRTMGWTPFLAGLLLIPKVLTSTHCLHCMINPFFWVQGIATILQTILIIVLMDFFAPCPKYSVGLAFSIASAIVICSLCTSFCYHPVCAPF